MNSKHSRERVLVELDLLAQPSLQLKYETTLQGRAGHAPSELIERFCSDIFAPKSQEFLSEFSDSELKSLCHLYGLMIEASSTKYPAVDAMLKDPAWRKVVTLAKELYVQLSRGA